jgi:EAL domain-containing protein (putative c-di-GMP-specific phosphodiesterase class I)
MGELRQAIERGELVLAYQPKIDLASERINGVEALLRWHHSVHGLIAPGEFIPPAEQTGLIKPLTLAVLAQAERQGRAWCAGGIELPISVNLSARNLHDPQFPDRIAELLRAGALRADLLELEITESAIMADSARALDGMTRLRALGLRFAIDDFGTGYSSLAYLQRLPVSAIKIDKSFVINMTRDENDAAIVRSTIDLAHNLGLKVIAEGVESRHVYQRLRQMGCDAAQGYFMCRPMPPEAFARWLRRSRWGRPR